MANTRFILNTDNKSQATWHLVRSELLMIVLRILSLEENKLLMEMKSLVI